MGVKEGRRPREAPISDGGWAALPARFRAWILGMQEELGATKRELEEAKRQLGRNSSNSSQPPSSDPPWTKKPKRVEDPDERSPRGGRKRRPGGQPGHEGHQRPLVPPEEVTEREELRPKRCGSCDRRLSKTLPAVEEPRRHQIAEIPEIACSVFEYVLHGVMCPDCDEVTYAKLPEGVSPSNFGVNLRSFLALFSGKYRGSRRQAVEFCRDVLGVEISVGAVDNICRRTSESLEAPVDEVAARVKKASVAYMDETGWRERGKRLWMWVVVTTFAVLFRIATRCKKEAAILLGEDFQGSLVSDRYGVYLQFAIERRQVCWAHLARDFQGLVDRGGVARRIGVEGIGVKDELFKVWRRYKAGKVRRDTMQRQMHDVEVAFGALLQKGVGCTDERAVSLCRTLVTVEPALFHFARAEGVEPTNNTAERAVRPAVLWRKVCFGTQSARGSRFVERMLTVTMTCRAQGRSPFQYLRSVILAQDRGDPVPSLFGGQGQESTQTRGSEAA